jgi:hypothetical protein
MRDNKDVQKKNWKKKNTMVILLALWLAIGGS